MADNTLNFKTRVSYSSAHKAQAETVSTRAITPLSPVASVDPVFLPSADAQQSLRTLIEQQVEQWQHDNYPQWHWKWVWRRPAGSRDGQWLWEWVFEEIETPKIFKPRSTT